MSKALKIGLFGGSFNPPTIAHLALAKHAHTALQLDQLWWLVAPHNPFKDKKTLAPFADRMAMADLVARDYSWLIASDWEARLGTQQTSDTLKGILQNNPEPEFIWLMGTDNLLHFHTWGNWQDVVKAVPVAVFSRPGEVEAALASPAAQTMGPPRLSKDAVHLQPGEWTLFDNEQMPISATKVRETVRNGQISDHILPGVADYIKEHDLYRL